MTAVKCNHPRIALKHRFTFADSLLTRPVEAMCRDCGEVFNVYSGASTGEYVMDETGGTTATMSPNTIAARDIEAGEVVWMNDLKH